MLFRSGIDYRPFSDEQIASFEKASGLQYASVFLWRDELDQAANDFIIDNYSEQWNPPSSLIKDLRRILKRPDAFIASLSQGIDHLPMPLSAVLCHGTGWRMEQFSPSMSREDLIAGVQREIDFLKRIIEKRKANGFRGNKGRPAVRAFINHLAFIFQDAFLQGATDGLVMPYCTSGLSECPYGPFLGFSKEVLKALESNLSNSVKTSDEDFPKLLKSWSSDTSTSIWNIFARSDYYALVTKEGKFPK